MPACSSSKDVELSDPTLLSCLLPAISCVQREGPCSRAELSGQYWSQHTVPSATLARGARDYVQWLSRLKTESGISPSPALAMGDWRFWEGLWLLCGQQAGSAHSLYIHSFIQQTGGKGSVKCQGHRKRCSPRKISCDPVTRSLTPVVSEAQTCRGLRCARRLGQLEGGLGRSKEPG